MFEAEVELDDRKQDLIVDAAYNFRMGGGTFSKEDWAALSTESRAAFVAAGQRIEIERAALLAELLKGEPVGD